MKAKKSTSFQPDKRIVIEKVMPQIDEGGFPARRCLGEKVAVKAYIFTDGTDSITAFLLYRCEGQKAWQRVPMLLLGNDEWQAVFVIEKMRPYRFTVQAWLDPFKTWQRDLQKRLDASQDVNTDMAIGAELLRKKIKDTRSPSLAAVLSGYLKRLTADEELQVRVSLALSQELTQLMEDDPGEGAVVMFGKELAIAVDRPKALFSTWYEIFPRSCSPDPSRPGTLKDCARLIPEIAQMGFDVLYLAPIYPIGKTNRKGKNNSTACTASDPGSPWAIGFGPGGHTAVHPELGTMDDFHALMKKAGEYGMEVALDIAFQCSPDHPFIKRHPAWFTWRPDGTIQYAENPPKKYEDIVPFNFGTKDRQALWKELTAIVLFWAKQGVRIFRIDNPHTKPFGFWQKLIGEVKEKYPGTIFLSEAFTRPKVMYRLAKIGFTQSYTYFTWRNTKEEFQDYLTELTKTEVAEFFRPNFWPNTPDILAGLLQNGGRAAFQARLVLAATLSSNYGIYGPAYELCVNTPLPGKEEYLDSEKYEIKHWDRNRPGNIKEFIARVNKIRKDNPALQMTRNIRFLAIDNHQLIAYVKASDDLSNIIITVVNLDPFHTQAGWLQVPLAELGIDQSHPYLAQDLLSNDKYVWQGPLNYIELNPQLAPTHILRLRARMYSEKDFDYYL